MVTERNNAAHGVFDRQVPVEGSLLAKTDKIALLVLTGPAAKQ